MRSSISSKLRLFLRYLYGSLFFSFNVPFFREIYDTSGYANFTARQAARGPEYAKATEGLDYQQALRSKIFRRDAGNVTDLASLQYLMR